MKVYPPHDDITPSALGFGLTLNPNEGGLPLVLVVVVAGVIVELVVEVILVVVTGSSKRRSKSSSSHGKS